MDKEQARFILQSFRPDGADAHDPDFGAALALAAEDRELGGWLARERAQDAAFAAALADVEIPDDLRESILRVLAGSAEADFSEMDAAFVGALASVRAPEGLRDQIVAAMEMQKSRTAQSAPVRAWKWLGSASIAAAVALGAWLAFQVTPGPVDDGPLADLTPASFEREAIKVLNASFSFDLRDSNPRPLFSYLADHKVPIPSDLPDGLERVRTLGCKVLKLDGHKASLVCFQIKGDGVVHLVVMDLDEISGKFGNESEAKKNCRHCPVSGWSRTTWSDDERVFLLLGKMKPEEIAEVL